MDGREKDEDNRGRIAKNRVVREDDYKTTRNNPEIGKKMHRGGKK